MVTTRIWTYPEKRLRRRQRARVGRLQVLDRVVFTALTNFEKPMKSFLKKLCGFCAKNR